MTSIERMITVSTHAAEVAGGRAEHEPDREADRDGDDADQEREARAVDDARELVARERVEPEPVLARRAVERVREAQAARAGRTARSAARRARRRRRTRRARSRRSQPGFALAAGATRPPTEPPLGGARSCDLSRLELGDRHLGRASDPRVEERVRDVDDRLTSTKTSARKRIPPWSTGKLRSSIASTSQLPMPGHANTVSVSTAPESSSPTWRPMIVETGSSRVPQHVPAVDDAAATCPWRAPCGRSPRSGRRARPRA